MKRFNEDLTTLMERIGSSEPQFVLDKLDRVRSRLVELKQRKIVKINHSAMELLVARSLIRAVLHDWFLMSILLGDLRLVLTLWSCGQSYEEVV